jgi:hypothetical protein
VRSSFSLLTAVIALPIASTWGWSVPQHPPTTDNRRNCRRDLSILPRQLLWIPGVEVRALIQLSMTSLRGIGAQPRIRSRHAPSRTRAPSR